MTTISKHDAKTGLREEPSSVHMETEKNLQDEKELTRRRFLRTAASMAAGLSIGVAAWTNRSYILLRFLPRMKDRYDDSRKFASKSIRSVRKIMYSPQEISFCTGKNPNIVLISIDTLRGDYFSPEHMPKTYEWALRNALIYQNAYSNDTWTLPSHLSILSGFLPHEHDVNRFHMKIPPSIPMIQEKLKDSGYYTYGFTNSGMVGEEFGFARGFDTWFEFFEPNQNFSSTLLEPLEKSKQILTKATVPFFAFVHTYYVHEYYLESFVLPKETTSDKKLADYRNGEIRRIPTLPDRKKYVRDRYAGTVRKFDAHLCEYVQWLAATFSNDLVIILTSDHGENLFDSMDMYGHGFPPIMNQIHVPLFIYGCEPEIRREPISLLNLPEVIFAASRNVSHKPKKEVISEHLTRGKSLFFEPRTYYTSHIDFDNEFSMVWCPQDEFIKKNPPLFPHDGKTTVSQEKIDQLKALGYLQPD